ncbi:YkgJ family cysteine cluster protein [Synechococcus sp. PCC 7336]|uniref:YkgJ family cysteine cluster protein n=1 Tax=Synechococcus sp. PCC 7336 TaxID=195250 RepID=UPI000348A253|nr:YkgJ family cysteine cluster protein [Synechococcus sp. PCC 7336]
MTDLNAGDRFSLSDRPVESQRGGWHCVSHCGACCYLEPDERDELDSYLSATELQQYLGMVGEDGWCIHYDRQQRQCSIYKSRPSFCRVTPQTFGVMFGVSADELPQYAAACCREHIGDIYGCASPEMDRFDRENDL